MDNDSTGNNDKRSWRERLGIGQKDLPKISDDFKSAPTASPVRATSAAPIAAKPVVRPVPAAPRAPAPVAPRVAVPAAPVVGGAKAAPRVVAKPAPAAPRVTVSSSADDTHRVVHGHTTSEHITSRQAAADHMIATVHGTTTQMTEHVTRAAVRAAPAPVVQQSESSEILAAKLKAQRDAAERLAETRVQAARQKAEAKVQSEVSSSPKYIFADDEPVRAAPPPPPPPAPTRTPLPPRPVARPQAPVAPPIQQPQMAPPRAPLGAGANLPPPPQRPAIPNPPPAQPPFGLPGYGQPHPQAYRAQMPPPQYRPIDPSQGYAPPPPPPQFQQRGFAPPPGRFAPPPAPPQNYAPPPVYQEPAYEPYEQEQAYVPPPAPPQPPQGFNRPMQRSMRPPPPPMDMGGDVFETPVRPQRRATAGDYGQAYRELETGYDEPQQSSSRGIWLLAGLLCLALGVAAGGAYFWNKMVKPGAVISTVDPGGTPVVPPPVVPDRTPPEQTPGTDTQSGAVTKKKIYDRIVGDAEVLGNNLVPTEEAPQQPEQGTQGEVPAVQGEAPQEGQPLPMPPPPGENGTIGDQGALPTPAQPSLATSEKSDPAAGESQAAVLPSATPAPDAQAGQSTTVATNNVQEQNTTPEPASANSELSQTATQEAPATQEPASLTEQPGTSQSAETVEDTATPAPVRKRITPKKPKPKVAASQGQRSLGSKPVVLVRARAAPIPRAERDSQPPQRRAARNTGGGVYQEEFVGNSDGGGIYGADLGNTSRSASASSVPSTPSRKKTLLGSFQNADDEVASAQTPAPTQARRPLFEQDQPRVTEQPVQRASTQAAATGYVAQLASFTSQAEANRASAALKSKYPQLVSQYRTVIWQAPVGGVTRYRVGLGPVATQSAANDVCAKLIAAGERDCLASRR
jgi:hypothetical protein